MSSKEKESHNKKLEKKLFINKESSWTTYYKEKKDEIFEFASKYKTFMKKSKTERLCIKNTIEELETSGFTNIKNKKNLSKGDKIYKNIKDKSIIACIIGENSDNFRIVASHTDSPRLDLKPSPLYEDSNVAMMQTHYYGGIKKYQWVNQPLSLEGVIYTKKGKKITISIGEKEDDPRFIVSDLLPHLAKEQVKKTGTKLIEGEDLNIMVGHLPIDDKDIKDKIKFNILKYLHDEYYITEEDFYFAELELVPSLNPMDIGFDRGLICAYGQDDKVCVYTSLMALIETQNPSYTTVAYFADKEETGSDGNTGAKSLALLNFTKEYCNLLGLKNDANLILADSKAISADVTAAINPNFKNVQDEQNASKLGNGVSIEKYGGGGGKYSTNDTNVEYMQFIREIANNHEIPWQTGELGKIDIGGGGTIAKFMANYGMECVDIGPCVVGMHSPAEITSKADVYSAYKLYKAFFE